MIDMMCNYSPQVVFGISSGVGALGFAAYSIYNKSKSTKKFKIEWHRLIDTTWQSVVAGIAAGSALTCSYYSILIALITGIGIDRLTNKIKISNTQLLNMVQLLAGLLTKTTKKRK